MQKLLFAASAIAVVIVTPALAADMPVKAHAPILAPAPAPTWTGFYIGADLGGTWFNQSTTWNPLPSSAAFGAFPNTGTDRASGVIGGVHAGYNYQLAPIWVVGIEGDWDGASAKGTVTQPILANPGGAPGVGAVTSLSSKLDWLASVRGRLGVLATPTVLAYVTGGVAWGQFGYSANAVNPALGYSAPVAFNQTQTGFVVGGGVEWMMTNNWLLRAEYLYYGFNSGPNVVGASATFPAFPSNYVWGKNNVNVARAGVSYKF